MLHQAVLQTLRRNLSLVIKGMTGSRCGMLAGSLAAILCSGSRTGSGIRRARMRQALGELSAKPLQAPHNSRSERI